MRGVFLVNHHRNVPALERDHENVFTEQQLEDAESTGMGLTTTWDLFRLIRGMIQWNWPKKTVQDTFYGRGRLSQLPSHYSLIGTAVHFYDGASVVSIQLANGSLRVGQRLGFLLPHGFFEEDVVSLGVEKQKVEQAQPGQKVGHKTTLGRKGTCPMEHGCTL